MRLAWMFVVLGLSAACALAQDKGVSPADEKAAIKPHSDGWITSANMPANAQRFDGKTLYLKITLKDGAISKIEAATAETANVVLSVVTREKENTMLSIKTTTAVSLKLDLYISPDNKRYMYASTCSFGNTYEMWGHDIAWFAVSNLRVVNQEDARICG